MGKFIGKLTSPDSKFSKDVYGEWQQVTRGTIQGWEGWVRAADGSFIIPGDYRLTEDDGKAGVVLVTSSADSSAGTGAARFRGNGPLPS